MEATIIQSVDSLWILIAGILVMFMQPGFMRLKLFHKIKKLSKHCYEKLYGFFNGAITYWAFGFALAYGGTTLGGFLAYVISS